MMGMGTRATKLQTGYQTFLLFSPPDAIHRSAGLAVKRRGMTPHGPRRQILLGKDTWEAIEFLSASSPDPNATESNLKLRLAAPASRCTVTTVNQTTAERGKEPLRTLGKIRRGKQLGWTLRPEWKPAAFFGWNVVPLREGLIAVGDDVEVLGQRSITSLSA
ncbi:hypothetical protein WJX84_000105 [Apatococcus fuscideae]|uniref:MOSC domain-containing protein n=1 Tax=Apatococcus fuscideae TaxID=2026836 RepID=A0AAW1SYD1_9CHLO